MNDKGQAALEFLVTYGWAILVLIVVLGVLFYFGIFTLPEKNNVDANNNLSSVNLSIGTEEYAIYVCNNLDNGTAVFPQIVTTRIDVQNTLGLKITALYGNETYMKMWDREGVMCAMPVEACDGKYLFCMDIDMIIPVSYDLHKQWMNGTYNEVNKNGTDDIFKKEDRIRDMSADSGRNKFIESASKTIHTEEHVLNNNSIELNIPPLDSPLMPKSKPEPLNEYLKKNGREVRDAPATADLNFKKKIVQMELIIDNKKLFNEIVDGINDIIDTYGSEAVSEFHIENYNESDNK